MNEKSNSTVLDKRPDLAVERRAACGLPYAEFLQEYVATNRPVVVEGAVQQWPAMRKWTPQFFKTRFPSKMVDVSYSAKMTFSDFIDAVEASSESAPGPYMYRLFLGPHLPELLADVTPPNEYSFPRRYACPLMPRVWRRPDGYLKLLIGGVGGKFPIMHFDGENAHAAITEIYGDKEFILFAPEDSPYLYPQSDHANHSQIRDLEHPDPEQFPLFSKATRYQTVVRPGDMIFVPSRWWHSARVLSTSISVCQNILDASNWDGYVADICRPARGMRAVKQVVKRIYLKSLGGLISTLEGTSRSRLAGAGSLGRRIAKLAPTQASQADDPTRWPVTDWVVR